MKTYELQSLHDEIWSEILLSQTKKEEHLTDECSTHIGFALDERALLTLLERIENLP